MFIAPEGLREILLSTVLLGALAWGASLIAWPLSFPFILVWIWVISFFRDPPRKRSYDPGELCAPADGTVTEVTELPSYPGIDGPAVRVGIFLSLFNVHINRAPCTARVAGTVHRKGEFLDARHPESGARNESNTLTLNPEAPLPGPVIVRLVAGLVARRIVCHARKDDDLRIGQRIGLIKFGSRTELIVPRLAGTKVLVRVGDRVHGGLTILVRQPNNHST